MRFHPLLIHAALDNWKDLDTPQIFDPIFAECDAVIHTADGGYPHVTSGEKYLENNRSLISSIEKSQRCRRLIFTSSDEAMLDGNLALLEANPIIDERRYTDSNDKNEYGTCRTHMCESKSLRSVLVDSHLCAH